MSKLYFRYGAMNCGKTTLLLQVAHNYEEKGMEVIIIKPATDTKGGDKIVSRLGVDRKVDILLKENDSIVEKIGNKKPAAILVDEAQFLTPKQVDELYLITKTLDIPVLCYGLRCDFQMKGFLGSPRLLEIADTIEEIKTVCSCGKKATQNMRLRDGKPLFDGGQVLIDDGTSDIEYVGVCGACYLKYKSESKSC